MVNHPIVHCKLSNGKSLGSTVSETSSTAFGLVEHFHLHQLGLFMLGNHHLSDAFAIVDDERFVGEVDQDDTHLATIVSVDGARGC